MKSVTVLGWWQQWFNSTRPRIFVWYFLLTAFSSVASILATHHILYERIYEESRESTSYQIKKFRRIASEEVVDSTLPPAEQAAAIFDAFLYKYKPADLDDYAITLLQGQVYRHTSLFPTELLSQDTALIQHWGQLNSAENKRVNTSIGKLLYVAEPIKIAEQTQGVLVIVHHTESIYQVIDGAVLLIIPAMLGVMIIAAAIAWVTAGRVLSPLRLLTQTAHSITESDMTQRIAVQGPAPLCAGSYLIQ